MSNSLKGLVVALATAVVVSIQMSTFPTHRWDDYAAFLVILAIPCGLYAGSLAGRLREDRFLRIAAFGLAIPGFLGFITVIAGDHLTSRIATALVGTSAIPIAIAAAALERWTRPTDLLPAANAGRGLRKPTTIELAAILSILVAVVIAAFIATGDHEPPQWGRWYERDPAVDADQFHEVFVFLAGATLPIGVLLGCIAQSIVTGRGVVMMIVALLGAMWIGCTFHVFTPIEFEQHYFVPLAVMVVVLARMTRPRLDRPRPPLGNVAIGALLGVANGTAISFVLLVIISNAMWTWSIQVLLVPCVILTFAIPAGALFGGLAARVAHSRRIVLHLVSQFCVLVLAMAFEIPISKEPTALVFFVWSCGTTATGVWILERATRTRHGSDPDSAGTGEALRDAESAGGGVVRG